MGKNDIPTKVLASIGTALVWFPVISPAVVSAIGFIAEGTFRFDYLMPAELFPVALVGGGLLMWAALRAHSHRTIIGWGLGIAAALLIGGQALAVATGLASGDIEPTGWQWAFVLLSIGIYSLALVVIGVGGVLLLRDLFRSPGSPTKSV